MTKILVYSKKDCPNCDMLKQLLNKENIQHKVVNIFTPEALTELSMNRVVTMSAPVLQIDNKFYTTRELCSNSDSINVNVIKEIIKNEVMYT